MRDTAQIYRGYQVELGAFSGPLDLLLHLIRRDEIDISDIPIARITESYLQYVHALQALDLEGVGDFLVMAATLMQIKSRMLLPRPPRPSVDPDDEEEEDDPRAELVQMLLEYKHYQQAARTLQNLQAARRLAFTRGPVDGDRRVLDPEFGDLSVFDLLWALDQVLQRAAPPDRMAVQRDPVTMAGQVRYLRHTLLRGRRACYFDELFGPDFSRLEIIVTFLALLELVSRGLLQVRQERAFGRISVAATEALLG